MQHNLIPSHLEGKQNDLQSAAEYPTEAAACHAFSIVKYRLQHPACWRQLAGALSGEFQPVSSEGNTITRPVQTGDLLRIDLPGPGTRTGNGFDWVRVEAVEDKYDEAVDEQLYGMRVRPARHPGEDTTAHFFMSTASSSFIALRKGVTVTVSYHGRNEQVNDDTPDKIDNLRNTLMAGAALAGVSELQWKALLDGLLENTAK